jgi:hypothetical protein
MTMASSQVILLNGPADSIFLHRSALISTLVDHSEGRAKRIASEEYRWGAAV